MRISDWSSDVCSSDLLLEGSHDDDAAILARHGSVRLQPHPRVAPSVGEVDRHARRKPDHETHPGQRGQVEHQVEAQQRRDRSEEHTSELHSLMRNPNAVFCLKKKIIYTTQQTDK